MTIKHIIISGGGPPGIIAYGVYKELEKKGFWNIKNIKTVYGTSIGALLSVMLILNYKWEWLDDYLMKRPWNKIVDFEAKTIFNIQNEWGVFDDTGVYKFLLPLVKGKNLSENLTMLELYEYSNIELHIFSTDINTMQKIDISHKTHQDLPVYKAIYMSLSIPGLFKPMCEDTRCYIDGGFINHYPITDCMKRDDVKPEEILGINMCSLTENVITENSSLSDIFFSLIIKLIGQSNSINNESSYEENTVICSPNNANGVMDWLYVLQDESKRREIIKQGEEEAIKYLKKINYKDVSKN